MLFWPHGAWNWVKRGGSGCADRQFEPTDRGGAMVWVADPASRHRVVLIDDDDDLRRFVRVALEISGRFVVVADAPDGRAGLKLAAALNPDLVVVDFELADVAGVDLVPRIHQACVEARIVIFCGAELYSDTATSRLPAGAHYVVQGDLDRLIATMDLAMSPAGTSGGGEEASLTLAAEARSALAARRFVVGACESWGGRVALDEIGLVVSELVTNAMTHTASTSFELRLCRHERTLRVEVRDSHGDAMPDPRPATQLDEHGRGLLLVSALSHAWGIEPDDGGKIVWAELPLGDQNGGEPLTA